MESAPSYEELNAMRLAHANQPEEVEETQQELIMRLLREQEQDAACAALVLDAILLMMRSVPPIP